MTAADTKQRILDAAESLFAEHGFGDVSLRQVVQQADVNVASIHYYFGSKEALIEEVLCRRLTPLNEERLRQLDAVESKAQAKGEVAALEDVLYSLIAPPMRLCRAADGVTHPFVQLVGRMFAEPNSSVQSMIKARFESLFQRFNQAFQAALPGVRKKEFFWRLHFLLGAMSLTLCDRQRPALWSDGACDPEDIDEVIAQLVTFVAAGMRADAAKKRRRR